MIKIKPDKEGFLTQWDIDRKVVISGLDGIEGVKVHFASPDDDHGAYVVDPVEQDGTVYADVPNILLTEPGRVDVFVYTTYTRVRAALMVFPREKPDDYVYTETEVLKYEDFVERLDGLETQKEDKANRVTTVDDKSDDEHYPTAKAVYKAIPKSLKNPYSLTFTGAVTGSYDGSKPMTFNIPVGGSGTDISLGVTGASVGDIIKVKAVDENGKPTAWEAAEMPGMMQLISESEISVDDVTEISYTGLENYSEIMIVLFTPYVRNANVTGATYINDIQYTKDWYKIQTGNLDMWNAIYLKKIAPSIYQFMEIGNINNYRLSAEHKQFWNIYDFEIASVKLSLNTALQSRTNAAGTAYPKSFLYAR